MILPPLPRPTMPDEHGLSGFYTADQMRAYAEAAALAMQDRIAAWLDEQHQKRKHLDNHAAFYAAAIRALDATP